MSDEQPFTHLTSSGDVHMVDVSAKEVTTREAVATAGVALSGRGPRRPLLWRPAQRRRSGCSEAGRDHRRQAHIRVDPPLPSAADRRGHESKSSRPTSGARITASVVTTGRTGVEMEAMTAVSGRRPDSL